MSTDHPDFPNRQFRREQWICLNGQWRFAVDDSGSASHPDDIESWDLRIEVPFAPESERSGIADRGFHADVWYSRDFELPPPTEGRVILHFGAVDYAAHVWVNDSHVGRHEGGHTPFAIDITDVLGRDGQQSLTVWASDDPHDLTKPRGKQDWQLQPHGIWYPRTTGIWQTVWLETIPDVRIENLVWTPHLERWEIGCDAAIVGNQDGDLELRVELSVDGRPIADDRYQVLDGEVHRRISLADPGIDDYRNELLWSPERPTLIDAVIELSRAGTVVDRISSYTALRGFTPQRGTLLLNNRPYYLRLVLDQGYWPESLMTPPSEEAIIRDIQLVKAAGFNGVRKHQKIEDPRFLYWADRLGLLVWEEMPSPYRFTHEAVERTVREWLEVIDRDYSHPCIVVWVPFNESWGVPNLPDSAPQRSAVQALYHLTRTLDPTRLVVGNDGWEATATDILGIHDYDHDATRIGHRYGPGGSGLEGDWQAGRLVTLDGHPHEGQPVVLSEFGGIGLPDTREAASTPIWGYSTSHSAEDFRSSYHVLLSAIHRIQAFCGFCYTQFSDTFQEANGLFFADREPKIPIDAIRSATMGFPRLPSEVSL